MSVPFIFHIDLLPTDFPRIRRNGFIKCEFVPPDSSTPKQMGYCIHCKKLFSVSWAGKHYRRLRNNDPNFSLFKPEKVDLYRADIVSELESLVEKGRASHEHFGPRPRQLGPVESACPSVDITIPDNTVLGQTCQTISTSQTLHSGRDHGFSDETLDGSSEQDLECVEEGLLKESFCLSEFDGEKFR